MTLSYSGASILENIPIEKIKLDLDNPRIKRFLEFQTDEPTWDHIYLALGTAGGSEAESTTSFEKLKNSIQTNGSVIEPIIVNRQADGSYLCIEGNTRVAIYRKFHSEKVRGTWEQIPALIYDGMDPEKIDAIRLQVHLVGRRPWDAYSKAKYLSDLRNKARLPFSEIVDFCGGRKKEVMESIQAFSDMEEFYRPIVTDDADFQPKKFSGFVELQKSGIKTAILKAGFKLSDFAKWIHEGKFNQLQTIRMLPRILPHAKARETFLAVDADTAIKMLERPDLAKTLTEANIGQIAQALIQKTYALSWVEAEKIKKDPTDETAQALNEVLIALNALLNGTQSDT